MTQIEKATAIFQKKCYDGAFYVCTCCHRTLYKKSVQTLCNAVYQDKNETEQKELISEIINKYTMNKSQASTKLYPIWCHTMQKEYIFPSVDGKLWICHTCLNSMKKGRIPIQAKANGLKLETIHEELSDLNDLESHLIGQRIPFMKICALPRGQQKAIHGPCVNVPSDIDNMCKLLPRLPSNAEVIPLKLKRKLCYKGSYMFKNIRPEQIKKALKWLKEHNPLYQDVDINDEWEECFLKEDTDFFEAITRADEDIIGDEPSCEGNNSKITSDVDVLRRSIRTDNQLQQISINTMEEEYADLNVIMATENKEVVDVLKDGNCLFHAVARQLKCSDMQHTNAKLLRQNLVQFLQLNPKRGNINYKNFLQLSQNTVDENVLMPDMYLEVQKECEWKRYLDKLKNGAWGDHICVQALCDMLEVKINVTTKINPNLPSLTPLSETVKGTLYLGLIGEIHYVSLEEKGLNTNEQYTENENEELLKADLEEFEKNVSFKGVPFSTCLQSENIYAIAP